MLFLVKGLLLAGQEIPLAAEKFFLPGEADSILYRATLEFAISRQYPESLFIKDFPEWKQEIIRISMPNVRKRLLRLISGYERLPESGSAGFEKSKTAFHREYFRGVRDALNEDKEFEKRIKIENENDRIVDFNSRIEVLENGTLEITETIIIYNGDGKYGAEADDIQRGIMREFPTHYTTKWGWKKKTGFELLEITRNGEADGWRKEKVSNGYRLFIGRQAYLIERGLHVYRIKYRTNRQLIHNHDLTELYWNVNGTGWNLKAESVRALIVFPDNAHISGFSCYTGAQGATNQDCECEKITDNELKVRANHALAEHEGLTVAAAMPAGIIIPPSRLDSVNLFVTDNLLFFLLALAILILFVLDFRAWWIKGRDPKGGTIIPQFSPPNDLSPADCGYLILQHFHPRLFTAALVDLVVKGLLQINVSKKGWIIKRIHYEFRRPDGRRADPPRDEKRYRWYEFDAERLYGISISKGEYNAVLSSVYNGLAGHVRQRIIKEPKPDKRSLNLLAFNDNYYGLGFFFMFLLGMGTLIWLLIENSPMLIYGCIALIISGLIIQIVFARIMSAYTPTGRALLDHILGFRMYLSAAEERPFNTLNPPEHNLQLFEKYLPYAIALGCDMQWSKRFDDVLDKTIAQDVTNVSQISLNSRSFASSGFSSGLSKTIASSGKSPSSGGSSGGGFSGGGGGGGGGGGW